MLSQWVAIALVGVLIAALLFAFIPVQKTITVHNSIINNLDLQRLLLDNVNIDACTGPGAPSSPCIANNAIELIPSGTFWRGTVCINNDDPVNNIAGIQVFLSGGFVTVGQTFVDPDDGAGPLVETLCFNSGGNGLRITGGATVSNNADITLAYEKEG